MSSIVADELAKIKSFETDTEKRRSELTLNELNYISDKQLHKKDGGGGSGFESVTVTFKFNDEPAEVLTLYLVAYEPGDSPYPCPTETSLDYSPNAHELPILKDSDMWSADFSFDHRFSIVGDYEEDGDGGIIVKGDLTITYETPENI